MTMTITRSCTDLYLFTFEERYNYLRLKAGVGVDTFGHERISKPAVLHFP